MKSTVVGLFSALVFASVANAVVQLPGNPGSPYVGLNIPVQLISRIGSDVAGGGAFNADVGPIGPAVVVHTAFWCVDDQTYFSYGDSGTANITRLDSFFPAANGAAANTVAFQDVGSPGYSGNWYNTTAPNGGALPTTARERLLMAAYLIQNYGGYLPFTTISGAPANQTVPNTNQDIQLAIWSLTNNTEFNSHSNGPGGYNGVTNCGGSGLACVTNSDGAGFWVNQALAHYQDPNAVNSSEWALVTWNVDSNGTPNSSSKQTFLVSLSPEPGFYGALALGLSGLALVISRKRKSA